MSASDKPGPDSAASEETTASEETKEKFRAALAAKQARKGEDHLKSGPAHPHGHGPIETKRTFRRKTG